MASKFKRGAIAYTQNGRRYIVDEIDDGIVYCSTESGAETEFSEAALYSEAEWSARGESRSGTIYAKVKRARPYNVAPTRLDPAVAEQALIKIERLKPGILDFAAFTIATRILAEAGEEEPVNGLSIAKCREVFDSATADIRANILATVLAAQADRMVDAGRLGDNLLRAILAKGMEGQEADFARMRGRNRQ